MKTHDYNKVISSFEELEKVNAGDEIVKTRAGGDMRVVKVRIAVAVDPDGNWRAIGLGTLTKDVEPEKSERLVADEGGNRCKVFWVEADVPIPESQVIQGTVS